MMNRVTYDTRSELSLKESLTLSTLSKIFPANRIWHFMQIVSIGDNWHGMSDSVFLEN